MRITLVRHGETTGQSSIRYYGATDVPLSDTGRAQMQRVRDALVSERFDAVFSSRLQRSAEAARIIGAAHGAVTPVAAFDEVNFGHWEGWTREEIAARDPEHYRVWQNAGPTFCYPGGEARSDFHARVAAGLAALLSERSGQALLMVLHRGVIAILLAELLRLAAEERARLDIGLGSIHVVANAGGVWRAEALDRIDHLTAPEGATP